MKMKTRVLIIAIILIISIIFILENPFKPRQKIDLKNYGTDIDDISPDIEFKTPDNHIIKFSDYKGKILIVNAWADWCPFCKQEMPDLQLAANENEEIALLFVHRTATEDANKAINVPKEYFKSRGIELKSKIVLDEEDNFYSTFFGFGMPVTLFIDKDGVIRDKKIGPMSLDEIRQRIQKILDSELKIAEQISIDKIKTMPDGTKYIISPDEIISGGPPKDGIPSIDNPKFISAGESSNFLSDNDIVFGIIINGEERAYPKKILVWHEIVNDKFSENPVLITYCPLCGTAIAFERRLQDGTEVEFGTSGKLWKSNLVMYDRKTDSYWSQILGKAILGPLSGEKLKLLPIDTILWKDWEKIHPNTKVLSLDTGFSRNYDIDPYEGYYSNLDVSFGASFSDARLHPKAMVSGININNKTKAYSVTKIREVGLLNDNLNGKKLLVLINPEIEINNFELNPIAIFDREIGGRELEFEIINNKIFDKQTKSQWNFNGLGITGEYKNKKLELIPATSAMWFSWLSVHPNTSLFYI